MSAFISLTGKLRGQVPVISPILAEHFISEAWRGVQGEREWSFLHKDGIVNFPAAISTGTISVTNGATQATFSAAAISAILADTSIPLLAYRQLRLPGQPARVFRIASVDSDFSTNGIVTLANVYTGVTNATSTYSLYCAYNVHLKANGGIETHLGSVLAYRSSRGTLLTGKHKTTQSQLNLVDPNRVNYGTPNSIAFHSLLPVDDRELGYSIPLMEYWPHCTSSLTLETRYIQLPKSFEDDPTQLLPPHIPEELILRKAKIMAYEWCESNRGQFEELRGVNWAYQRAQLTGQDIYNPLTYKHVLRQAIHRDDAFINNSIIDPSHYKKYGAIYSQIPTTQLVAVRS